MRKESLHQSTVLPTTYQAKSPHKQIRKVAQLSHTWRYSACVMCLATWNLATAISQKYCFVFNIENWHAALLLQQAALRGDARVLCILPGFPPIVFTRPHADSTAKSNSVFLLKILVMFLWGTLTIR